MEQNKYGLIDFLQTDIPKEELAAALKALKAFKACESDREYLTIWFAAWAKLEQFEEYLEHMVNGVPLQEDTVRELRKVEK